MRKYWQCVAAALLAASVSAQAQFGTIPEPCAKLKGGEFHECMRRVTPPARAPQIEPVESKPDPAQLVNCLQVLQADRTFCIHRNELITECRDVRKYPDFGQCIATLMARLAKPPLANCQKEKRELRATCATRNQVLDQCFEDPLRYFTCINNKGRVGHQRGDAGRTAPLQSRAAAGS